MRIAYLQLIICFLLASCSSRNGPSSGSINFYLDKDQYDALITRPWIQAHFYKHGFSRSGGGFIFDRRASLVLALKNAKGINEGENSQSISWGNNYLETIGTAKLVEGEYALALLGSEPKGSWLVMLGYVSVAPINGKEPSLRDVFGTDKIDILKIISENESGNQ